MLTLNTLSSSKGAHKNIKRLGRGHGSGQGTQAGKGHKGQKARKSGHVRTGYEGGSMPLYMRLPKRGFSNHEFKTEYAIVNLSSLEKKFSNQEVTRESLIELGLLKGINKTSPIKILGKGELTRPLKFIGIESFSKSATEAINKSGGSIQ